MEQSLRGPLQEAFRAADVRLQEYASFLEQICGIESKSEDKQAIDRVCEAVLAKGEECGFIVRRFPQEKAGNVASLTYNPEGKKPMVCVSAHMDTVHLKGAFGDPPVRRDGDVLRGPGVMDCKGGIAVGLLVMHILKDIGYGDRPVRLILQSEEEIQCILSGGKTLDFLREEAEGAAAFFNLEGREPGKITTFRKGIIRAEMTVRGRAAHAGDYFEGISAVREAAHKVIRLEKQSEKDGITYNCGIIRGGTAMNVIPAECRIYIDVRIRSDEEYRKAMRVLEEAAAHADAPGTSSEVRVISSRRPMERTEANVALFRHIDFVCRACGFGPMEENASNGGSDAAYASLMGIPTVDDLGVIGDHYHSLDEWCSIPSIAESAKIIVASILAMD